MQKRIFTAALAALLCLTSLAACAKPGDAADTTAAPASTTAPDAPTETTQSEKDANLAALPSGDFAGQEFLILNVEVPWCDTPFSATEITGETFNDALYQRDEFIREKLGVTIVEERDSRSNVASRVRVSAQALDGAYGAAICHTPTLGGIVQQGLATDMSTYSALQFDKPWWNAELMENVNFGKKTPILFGDFHIGIPTSHYVIAFSKSLIEQNTLEEPYALMEKNEWTWDKMHEMMNVVARDVNGDGKHRTEDDIYGFGNYSNAPKNFIMSAEVSLLSYDSEGIPTFTAQSDEQYLSAWDKMIRLFCTDERMISMPGIEGYSMIVPNVDGYKTLFSEGRLLFYHEIVGTMRDLRESEYEYGLVPYPKYDASQAEYISVINPDSMTMIVPLGDKDPEMTGIVLENITAYTHYTVIPAFVETTLHYKYARDEKSIETLNAILASNKLELAYLYDWSGIWGIMDTFTASGTANIASRLTTYAKLVQKQIDKTVAALNE